MPVYQITTPEGRQFLVDAASHEEANDVLMKELGSEKQMSGFDTAMSALKNVPKSFVEDIAKPLGQAVSHPVDTLGAAASLPIGALAKMFPDMAKSFQPGSVEKAKQLTDAVVNQYKENYGSVEGFKRYIAEHPMAVAADVATLFGLGSGAANLAGKGAAAANAPKTAAYLGKTADFLSGVSTATDPTTMPLRAAQAGLKAAKGTAVGAGNVAANVVGQMTGAGGEPIRQAFKAGLEGGDAAQTFKANIKGTAPIEDALNIARENLAGMRQRSLDMYEQGMASVNKNPAPLGFDLVDDAIAKAKQRSGIGGIVTDPDVIDAVSRAESLVNEFKQKAATDPIYSTAKYLDALKQGIGNIMYKPTTGGSKLTPNAKGAVGAIYHSLKNTISKGDPTYAKVMEKSSAAIEEIQKMEELIGRGDKVNVDAVLRKLQGVMRDNVNTNYGYRTNVAKQLAAQGKDFMPALAGQALGTWTPRGMQGAVAGAGELGALGYGLMTANPALVGTALSGAALSSPRLMGNVAYRAGAAGRPVSKAIGMMPDMTGARIPAAGLPMNLLEALAIQQEEQKKGK